MVAPRAGYAPGMSELLTGDLYRFEELLSARERETLDRVRRFLRAEVAPVANEQWTRAEFPAHLIKGYAGSGTPPRSCAAPAAASPGRPSA